MTTSLGLEDCLVEEIEETIGDFKISHCRAATKGAGGVYVLGTWEAVSLFNLNLTCASRVLWVLGEGSVSSLEDVYNSVYSLPWTQFFTPGQTFAVKAHCSESDITNSQIFALKTKDAIVDAFRTFAGERPNVDTENPDVRVHVRVHRNLLSVSLDTTGEPLDKRHYRIKSGAAPLRENVAAGLLRLAGWSQLVNAIWIGADEPAFFERVKSQDEAELTDDQRKIAKKILLSPFLLDPMCGTGTFAIEAALALIRRRPAARREGFAFHGFLPKRSPFLRRVYSDARAQVLGREKSVAETLLAIEKYAENAGIEFFGNALSAPLLASDMSRATIDDAKQNAEKAGVSKLIQFRVADADHIKPHASHGILMANPPYGERLTQDDLPGLYKSLGDIWKDRFPHWLCYLYTGAPQLAKAIGLRPTRNHAVWSGNIEGKLSQFYLYPKKPPTEE